MVDRGTHLIQQVWPTIKCQFWPLKGKKSGHPKLKERTEYHQSHYSSSWGENKYVNQISWSFWSSHPTVLCEISLKAANIITLKKKSQEHIIKAGSNIWGPWLVVRNVSAVHLVVASGVTLFDSYSSNNKACKTQNNDYIKTKEKQEIASCFWLWMWPIVPPTCKAAGRSVEWVSQRLPGSQCFLWQTL